MAGIFAAAIHRQLESVELRFSNDLHDLIKSDIGFVTEISQETQLHHEQILCQLCDCPNLRSFTLDALDCWFTPELIKQLQQQKSLQESRMTLYLTNSDQALQMLPLLNQVPHLRELNILPSSFTPTQKWMETPLRLSLAEIESVTILHPILELEDCSRLKSATTFTNQLSIKNCPELKELKLDSLREVNTRNLRSMPWFNQMRKLHLQNLASLQELALEGYSLIHIQECSQLKTLTIDSKAARFSNCTLLNLPALTTLRHSGWPGKLSIKELPELKELMFFNRLKISDADIEKMTKLQHLLLDLSTSSDQELDEFCNALPHFTELRELHLTLNLNNSLYFWTALSKLPKLELLHVQNTRGKLVQRDQITLPASLRYFVFQPLPPIADIKDIDYALRKQFTKQLPQLRLFDDPYVSTYLLQNTQTQWTDKVTGLEELWKASIYCTD